MKTTTIQSSTSKIEFGEKYGPFINGEVVEAANGYIDAVNAATGEVLSKIGARRQRGC